MKAAIVIDRWKLPIFTRHLKEAGFSYEEHGAAAPETLLLTVITDEPAKLQRAVVAATVECKNMKGPQ
ncbi:hypothetical protein ACSFBF_07135 [Variovorax sp. ZT5P49]|uniref:hypothetical protein n=1 Tax=Variovorax sp. ZT5P49 TaxID=3443733 RepID=UPI003F454600